MLRLAGGRSVLLEIGLITGCADLVVHRGIDAEQNVQQRWIAVSMSASRTGWDWHPGWLGREYDRELWRSDHDDPRGGRWPTCAGFVCWIRCQLQARLISL
jgi:hypothetical protein